MKIHFCILILFLIAACSTGSHHDDDGDAMGTETAAQAAKERFSDVHDVMILTDETMDPLFGGKWEGTDIDRRRLAWHADMLAIGFGWVQTTLKPKDVDAGFASLAEDTAVFMQQLSKAANKDSESVKALFLDPRAVGKNYCGRCHDKYRDD